MFRCFDIIAAAAYAAENAAREYDHDDPLGPPWDELTDADRHTQVQRIMAFKRGESEVTGYSAPSVFEATAKAILDFNGGQGGLALEELTALGAVPFDLELVKEAEVAGRNIRDVIADLLNELAERRASPAAVADPAFFQSPRFQALSLGVEHFPQDALKAAEIFLPLVTSTSGGTCLASVNALSLACRTLEEAEGKGHYSPQMVADLAQLFGEFIAAGLVKPVAPEIAAELEDATVQ